jgi:hypothetical protein
VVTFFESIKRDDFRWEFSPNTMLENQVCFYSSTNEIYNLNEINYYCRCSSQLY